MFSRVVAEILPKSPISADALERLLTFRHHDPFEIVGRHPHGVEETIRVMLPEARSASLDGAHELSRLADTCLFEWTGPTGTVERHYSVRWQHESGEHYEYIDPYSFTPQLDDDHLGRFSAGTDVRSYRLLGAHHHVADGITGALFSVWAPNAQRISVVGTFNNWDGRAHPMRVRGSSGVWELFVPSIAAGETYKFEICARESNQVFLKIDPYANSFERRPATACVFTPRSQHEWQDEAWLCARSRSDFRHAPLSIYEVHLGSWQNEGAGEGGFTNYRLLADSLATYVKRLGFTHIELLPLTEHPLDASWGYQTVGYFAPTSRYGTADDFRAFVDTCHQHGIGVLLDWAPAHFPKDAHALARYDGQALYEHADPRNAEQRDWGTLTFDFGRPEVKEFLVSSALYWLDEFHIDGLRVDAVAAMLYLDYSKQDGEWLPNRYGGHENLEAIELLRDLNQAVHENYPGALTIAEESTSWPQVTGPSWLGGLGFSMKWNLGWMNDTLRYFHHDPVHRSYHHDKLTFGLTYNFSENFVLPLSHDEVVHLKRSLLDKMPGDEWQRFANLRLLYAYLWTYPGKKLLFMGGEFGQSGEWNHETSLNWPTPDDQRRAGLQLLVGELNKLYQAEPALHTDEFDADGFRWIDCHDTAQSVISFERIGAGETLIVVLNFTPVVRHAYRVGAPSGGTYDEVLNTDARAFGGSNAGNQGRIEAQAGTWMSRPFSLEITLPPLACLVFKTATQ